MDIQSRITIFLLNQSVKQAEKSIVQCLPNLLTTTHRNQFIKQFTLHLDPGHPYLYCCHKGCMKQCLPTLGAMFFGIYTFFHSVFCNASSFSVLHRFHHHWWIMMLPALSTIPMMEKNKIQKCTIKHTWGKCAKVTAGLELQGVHLSFPICL